MEFWLKEMSQVCHGRGLGLSCTRMSRGSWHSGIWALCCAGDF